MCKWSWVLKHHIDYLKQQEGTVKTLVENKLKSLQKYELTVIAKVRADSNFMKSIMNTDSKIKRDRMNMDLTAGMVQMISSPKTVSVCGYTSSSKAEIQRAEVNQEMQALVDLSRQEFELLRIKD